MKGLKGKKPTVEWYFQDWLSDDQIGKVSAATRGVWFEVLNVMFKENSCGRGTGFLKGNAGELVKQLRITKTELEQFLTEAKDVSFCNVSAESPQIFLIENRRMSREFKQREIWRNQKKSQRCPENVHPVFHPSRARSSSSSSSKEEEEGKRKPGVVDRRAGYATRPAAIDATTPGYHKKMPRCPKCNGVLINGFCPECKKEKG